jgi:hypothetical protein
LDDGSMIKYTQSRLSAFDHAFDHAVSPTTPADLSMVGLEHGGSPVTRRSAKDLFAFESSAFRSPSAASPTTPARRWHRTARTKGVLDDLPVAYLNTRSNILASAANVRKSRVPTVTGRAVITTPRGHGHAHGHCRDSRRVLPVKPGRPGIRPRQNRPGFRIAVEDTAPVRDRVNRSRMLSDSVWWKMLRP